MNDVALKQFLKFRESMLKRKAEIEAELAELNAVLGPLPVPAFTAPPTANISTPLKERAKRAKNSISLAEAVLAATKSAALTKEEILTAVAKLGYQFSAKSPLNSLNTLLYTDKRFKNSDGKFAPTLDAFFSSP